MNTRVRRSRSRRLTGRRRSRRRRADRRRRRPTRSRSSSRRKAHGTRCRRSGRAAAGARPIRPPGLEQIEVGPVPGAADVQERLYAADHVVTLTLLAPAVRLAPLSFSLSIMGAHARAAQRIDADAIIGRARDEHKVTSPITAVVMSLTSLRLIEPASFSLSVPVSAPVGGVDRKDADAVVVPPAIRKAVAPIVTSSSPARRPAPARPRRRGSRGRSAGRRRRRGRC